MPDRVTLVAPAKVNLYLAVGERRPDGYHALTTVFQALDDRLADVVELRRAVTFSVDMRPDAGVSASENLALRAARLLARESGVGSGLAIRIDKHIPAGGGLGGASSNAAAVLLGASILWGLDPANDVVLQCARSLGADVPFFLDGGTALYAGRGDVRVATLPTPALELVVVTAGEPVATAAAYALFDQMQVPPAPALESLTGAISAGDAAAIARALHNDLAPAARALAPGTREVESWLADHDGVLGAAVTGSGSCVFGVCGSAEGAARVAEEAGAAGWWACACSTSGAGARALAVG